MIICNHAERGIEGGCSRHSGQTFELANSSLFNMVLLCHFILAGTVDIDMVLMMMMEGSKKLVLVILRKFHLSRLKFYLYICPKSSKHTVIIPTYNTQYNLFPLS